MLLYFGGVSKTKLKIGHGTSCAAVHLKTRQGCWGSPAAVVWGLVWCPTAFFGWIRHGAVTFGAAPWQQRAA